MEEYDVILVGTGAGGSILAKELINQKKKILILEKGKLSKGVGTFKFLLNSYNFSKILKLPTRTIEGVPVYQGILAGGSAALSMMNAKVTLQDELLELGVDISKEIEEIREDYGVTPTQEKLYSSATKEMIKSAKKLGLNMAPMNKFLDNDKCTKCGYCVLGCAYQAKYSSDRLFRKRIVREKTVFNAEVTRVLSDKNIARGVEYIVDGKMKTAIGRKIILSSGAISTPRILMNSNIDAGKNLSLDMYINVYGYSDKFNQLDEPPMPVVSFDNLDKGFLISPFISSSYIVRMMEGLSVARFPKKGLVGLMVKIKDDSTGEVREDGTITKPITYEDKQKLKHGTELAKDILRGIGIKNRNISLSKIQGAHPIGTAAIGDVVNSSFETKIKNLFVCDASILPKAPGLPPKWTIMALAKKLSKQLGEECA
jgi:choline dehydrogenase-like flavoprotein